MKNILLLCVLMSGIYSCQSPSAPQPESTDNNATDISDSATLHQGDSTGGAAQYPAVTTADTSVTKALTYIRQYLKDDLDKNLIDSGSRKMMVEEVDLNNDGYNEMFVGLLGPYFCGSGGCTVVLFDHTGKQISRFTVVNYPVGIDSEMTGGWKNLILESNGGHHLVKHNGKGYPSNASVLPAFDLKKSKGMEAIFVTDDMSNFATF